MNGYRRAEPAFCRGCGRAWAPGADSCGECGEVLERASTVSNDPRVIARLKSTIIAAFSVMAVSWFVLLRGNANDPSLLFAVGLRAGLCALLVVTVGLWHIGGRSASLRSLGRDGRRVGPMVAAVLLGLALPAAYGFGFAADDLWFWLLTAEAEAFYAGEGLVWVAALLLATAFEELLFRGLLFDAVEEVGGARNAVIASVVVFAFVTFSPTYALLGLVAAGLRYVSGSVAPAVVFRWVASSMWLFFVWTQMQI